MDARYCILERILAVTRKSIVFDEGDRDKRRR